MKPVTVVLEGLYVHAVYNPARSVEVAHGPTIPFHAAEMAARMSFNGMMYLVRR
jgi:hypothetical protein